MLIALLLAAVPVDPEVAGFWGPENVQRLGAPAKVELFRVRPHEEHEPAPKLGVIGGYAVTAARGAVPPARVAPLVALLLARSTYGSFQGGKLCGGLHPGLAVRFTDAKGSTDVLLCFSCDDLAWVSGTPKNRQQLGRSSSWENSPSRAAREASRTWSSHAVGPARRGRHPKEIA